MPPTESPTSAPTLVSLVVISSPLTFFLTLGILSYFPRRTAADHGRAQRDPVQHPLAFAVPQPFGLADSPYGHAKHGTSQLDDAPTARVAQSGSKRTGADERASWHLDNVVPPLYHSTDQAPTQSPSTQPTMVMACRLRLISAPGTPAWRRLMEENVLLSQPPAFV